MQRLGQESRALRDEVDLWRKLEARARDLTGLAEMAIAENEQPLEGTLRAELDALQRDLDRHEVDLLFSGPYADHPAIVSIYAGAGGTDSQDWAAMLLRMYLRWAERDHRCRRECAPAHQHHYERSGADRRRGHVCLRGRTSWRTSVPISRKTW